MTVVIEKKRKKLLGMKDTMFFGKYEGLSIGELISRDPNYVAWALKNIGHFKLNKEATKAYKQRKFW